MLLAGRRAGRFHRGFSLGRYDLAEAMLRDDPSRIGPDGRDTIALHVCGQQTQRRGGALAHRPRVDVNAKRVMWDCNHTALHMTADDGNVEIARMLLDAGADPHIHDDKYDNTALGWAEFCGQDGLAQLLRERGAAK